MAPTDKLVIQAAELATAFDENFLELARTLRQLHDIGPGEFVQGVTAAKLSVRKARYLIAIDRAFSSLAVTKARLRRIGWTRLRTH